MHVRCTKCLVFFTSTSSICKAFYTSTLLHVNAILFAWGNQVHACTRSFFAPLDTLTEIKITGVDSLRYFSTFSHSVTYLSSRFVPAVVATINAIMAGTNNLGSLLYVCNHPFETYLIHCIRLLGNTAIVLSAQT